MFIVLLHSEKWYSIAIVDYRPKVHCYYYINVHGHGWHNVSPSQYVNYFLLTILYFRPNIFDTYMHWINYRISVYVTLIVVYSESPEHTKFNYRENQQKPQ